MQRSCKIVIEVRAEKELRKLSPHIRKRIAGAIDGLALNPQPLAAKKMVGSDCLRLRVGEYRVIYRIEGHILQIYIIHIGHRREVYR